MLSSSGVGGLEIVQTFINLYNANTTILAIIITIITITNADNDNNNNDNDNMI